MNSNKLFYRDGREFTGTAQLTEKGKPFTLVQTKCGRCGGAGGAEKWRHTGWTCFECGGKGLGRVVEAKLYTEEQLVKLNAAAAKRQTKKEAELATKRAAWAAATVAREAELATKRANFLEVNKELFAVAASLNDEFINTMVSQCVERASISTAQIELINKRVAEAKTKAGSAHVGTKGERRDFVCKLEKFFDWSKPGFPHIYKYCHIMRDEQGNAIKYVGSKILGGLHTPEGYRFAIPDPNAVIRFKATIDAHTEFGGEKQTVVSRPKVQGE
jgi:hypothetical protein